MKIEVITSITGNKDTLRNNQVKGDAVFTVFTDNNDLTSETWNVKPAFDRFIDPRRNSRIHKILIHKYSDADVTLWIDGNKRLLISPEEIVKKYLHDYDIAIFAHVVRDCLYDEAMTCAKLNLDDPEVIIEQAKYYEDREWAKHKGLCEGGFILRRNNARTHAFNEAWWADYCRFSRRDQLSLMPALEKSRANVYFIPEGYLVTPQGAAIREGGAVEMVQHENFEGNFNQTR